MEAIKKTSVIVLASVAAAAAGIAVVVAVTKWRERSLIGDRMESGLRGVQDVITDCYRKIDEIERNLPVVGSAKSNSVQGTPSMFRAFSNGNPAMES